MKESILLEVSAERAAQDREYGPRHDDAHTLNDWIAILTRHAGLAANDGAKLDEPSRFRRQMVRIAALAVAAIESLDRKALAPTPPVERVAGDHQSGKGV